MGVDEAPRVVGMQIEAKPAIRTNTKAKIALLTILSLGSW